MSAFAPRTIDYVENRADGGYAWDVCYDLSCVGNTVEVDLRVRLTGEDPGAFAATWQYGVDSAWNQKVFFSDGERLYEVKLDFAFVESGEHYVVNVHSGSRPFDMLNWDTTYGGGLDDEVAAHEVGHMLGNFDEYAGGATHEGYTRTGTLMSDLTVTGFQGYFGSIEHFAELHGDMSLSTVLARVGSAGRDALDGTPAMDGFYGLEGDDTIDGLGGNDYIDAGAGNDVLRGGGGAGEDILIAGAGNDALDGASGGDLLHGQGGKDALAGRAGRDTLCGGAGADQFVFNTALNAGANVDRVTDFSAVDDIVKLDDDVFTALATGALSSGAFHSGPGAAAGQDAGDRIVYNTSNGCLYYDPDGPAGAAATLFCTLAGAPAITAADFFVAA